MAELVLGIGTSHGPLLSLEAERWSDRAQDDLRNQRLNLSDGRWISYTDLAAERGAPYADTATVEQFRAKEDASQKALDRIAADLARVAPDVVLIVGDDHGELFSMNNIPAVSIFYGEELLTKKWPITPQTPEYRKTVVKGYAMDEVYSFPGAASFARDLIAQLMARNIDVAAAAKVEDPLKFGLGHAYGFVIKRLFNGRPIPVVPILLNTYFPPNVPTAARCYDMGKAIRAAIEEHDSDLRVAIVASGGLSHFVVDEDLDARVIDAMCKGEAEPLRSLPAGALNAGSSEILNWVLVAGAVAGMTNRWIEYQPIYRTPAGTGIGVAFGVWE
jgi:hypothetical protein